MTDFRYAQTNIQLFEQLRQGGMPEAERARVAAAYDLAARLFTGRFRCSGKTFLAHLVGTASVAARHGGSEPIVSAALLHAAYDQGDFGILLRGLTAGNRESVRRAVAGQYARPPAGSACAAAISTPRQQIPMANPTIDPTQRR